MTDQQKNDEQVTDSPNITRRGLGTTFGDGIRFGLGFWLAGFLVWFGILALISLITYPFTGFVFFPKLAG